MGSIIITHVDGTSPSHCRRGINRTIQVVMYRRTFCFSNDLSKIKFLFKHFILEKIIN